MLVSIEPVANMPHMYTVKLLSFLVLGVKDVRKRVAIQVQRNQRKWENKILCFDSILPNGGIFLYLVLFLLIVSLSSLDKIWLKS